VLDASTATITLSGGNSNSRVIGGKLAGSTLFGPFSGAIDELKAWNRNVLPNRSWLEWAQSLLEMKLV
jgi:hypothetical protein